MLIRDLNVRIIHAATGEIIRALTLDTTRNYQPTGLRTPQKQTIRTLMQVRIVSDLSQDHIVAGAGFEPATFGL